MATDEIGCDQLGWAGEKRFGERLGVLSDGRGGDGNVLRDRAFLD